MNDAPDLTEDIHSTVTRREARERAGKLIQSFGLTGQRRTLIGTPLQKGISGGQKRRVSVATQLITGPRVLYLDEPTSGLDSTASYEVISFIRDIARRTKAGLTIYLSARVAGEGFRLTRSYS